MKSIFVIIFLTMSSLMFAANKIDTAFMDNVELGIKIPAKKKAKMKQAKTMVAYEFYYTIDWLYNETPFSHKLEVYA